MPSIPIVNPLGYVGVFLVIAGLFLAIAGLDLIKIEKLTITPGRKTWGIGLLLAAIGILFLLPEISSAINSPAAPTAAVVTVAPNATVPPPTHTNVIAPTIQRTSVTNIPPAAETSTSLRLTLEAPTAAAMSVACVTSKTGTGVPAEVQADSLMFYHLSASYPAPKLPLADGAEILFSNMKSFEVIQVSQNPDRLTVTINLLNGDVITDDVREYNSFWDRLEGTAKYGTFKITLPDVKRIEFREQEGCK
jgi:hypothetical protein